MRASDAKARQARQQVRDTQSRLLKRLGPEVEAAGRRLLDDFQTEELWADGRLTDAVFFDAVLEFFGAVDRDPWDLKPKGARDQWLADLNRAIECLINLMEEAPIIPDVYGFPAKDLALRDVAHALGVEVPSEDDPKFWATIQELEIAVNNLDWTLADALRDYRTKQTFAADGSFGLPKPKDKNAPRKHFVARLIGACNHLSNKDVQLIASVMFGEDVMDEAQVGRIRRQFFPDS